MSQSFCPLDTGVPSSSNAQVRWAQDGSRLSVLAELQAGTEHLKVEFNGGKTDQVIPRWEFFSRLQHQVKALLKRGVSSSIQAKAHYQVQDYLLFFYPEQARILLLHQCVIFLRICAHTYLCFLYFHVFLPTVS